MLVEYKLVEMELRDTLRIIVAHRASHPGDAQIYGP
jgi:hypothetical protein